LNRLGLLDAVDVGQAMSVLLATTAIFNSISETYDYEQLHTGENQNISAIMPLNLDSIILRLNPIV